MCASSPHVTTSFSWLDQVSELGSLYSTWWSVWYRMSIQYMFVGLMNRCVGVQQMLIKWKMKTILPILHEGGLSNLRGFVGGIIESGSILANFQCIDGISVYTHTHIYMDKICPWTIYICVWRWKWATILDDCGFVLNCCLVWGITSIWLWQHGLHWGDGNSQAFPRLGRMLY